MQRKMFIFATAIVLALLSAFNSTGLFNANAQRPTNRRVQEEAPLDRPLAKDDPRAQLNPEWLNVKTMTLPEDAHTGAPLDPVYGASEASFDLATREQEVRYEARQEQNNALAQVAQAYPGNIGANAELDELDARNKQNNNQDNVVVGVDNRVKITATTTFPWRTITKLLITFPNGARSGCSGALIASKYVLTAGHCVHSAANGGWATTVEVIPGLNGTYKPYGSAFSTRLRSYIGWTRDRDANYDFALVTLNRHVGSSTGWLGYAYIPSINGVIGNLSGYPGDRDGGTGMYYHSGPMRNATFYRVTYDIDTAGGQSGSNIYRLLDGQRHVFAVHTNGSSSGNSGARITSQRFDDLKAWIASGI